MVVPGGVNPRALLDDSGAFEESDIQKLAEAVQHLSSPQGRFNPVFSGIGSMRDIGDPNDPRRGTSAPQQSPVPGLPRPEPFSGYEVLPGESAKTSSRGNVAPYRDQGGDLPRRGFGSGGGMYIQPPQGRSGQKRTMIYGEDGVSIPTDATRGQKAPYFTNYQRSRSGTPAVDRSKVARPEPEMPAVRGQTSQFVQQGPAPQLTSEDQAMLEAFMGRAGNAVNETDVVQTLSGKKQRGSLSQDDLTPHSRGSFIDPSLASTPEISPYSTIEVPVRGRDGQVRGTRTIDPQAIAETRTGDLDAIHSSESTDEVSIAKRASELKTDARTPMISGTDLNELAATGQARRPNPNEQDRNLAGYITRGGQEVPIYRTTLDKQTSNGPVAMYRIGAPNNTNWNEMRDAANPRFKQEGGPFDTQVVRQPKSRAGLRRQIDDVISGAQSKGSTVYQVDPTTGGRTAITEESGLTADDFYVESADGSQKTHLLRERGEPETVMGRVTQQGEPTGRAIIASGAGRGEERVTETGPVPFLNREDVYGKIGGLRKNVEKQVQADKNFADATTRLDDVMTELATSGFMETPDTVNVTRKMASAVLQGQMNPDAVPESIRSEVAAELRAMQGQGREVVLTQEPATTGDVGVDSVAATAAEARGPVKAFIDRPQTSMAADAEELGGFLGQDRNTDGSGDRVQSAYSDFGENRGDDAGFNRGFSTKAGYTFQSAEVEALESDIKARLAQAMGLPTDQRGLEVAATTSAGRGLIQQVDGLTPLVMRNVVAGDSLDSAIKQFTGGDVSTVQGQFQGPNYQAPVTNMAIAETLNNRAAMQEGSSVPQSSAQGVTNTDQVSQINAPAPPSSIANPAVGGQIDNKAFLDQQVAAGNVRQQAADNIRAGLQPGASDARQAAANQLLSSFRRRFGG